MPGKRPHLLAATVPPDRLTAALVKNLARTTGGRVAYRVPEPAGLTVGAAWPEDGAVPGTSDVGVVWPEHGAVPGTSDTVVAQEPVDGGGLVLVSAPRRWGAAEREALRETAGWLGVAARLESLRTDHDRARARAHALRAEVTTTRGKLAQVRDIERRRLVRAITTTTLRDLDGVRRRLRQAGTREPEPPQPRQALGGVGKVGPPEPRQAPDDVRKVGPPEVRDPPDELWTTALAEARDALDDLLESFRAIVRGVYPAMLPDRGPKEALEELAATLPRPVRFGGDPGRSNWPAESGLYHAVAAVLTLLAGKENEPGAKAPVVVDFGRAGALRARVTAPAGCLSQTELCSALAHDAERLAVLGGTMECVVTQGWVVVAIRLDQDDLRLPCAHQTKTRPDTSIMPAIQRLVVPR